MATQVGAFMLNVGRSPLVSAAVGLAATVAVQGLESPAVSNPAVTSESLYVVVRDDEQFVKGLTGENFELYVGGQRRTFELRGAEPARIALLVENSPATRSRVDVPYLDDIVSAIRGFEQAAPPGHWYALAAYGDELTIARDFTKRRGDVLNFL